ncbi:MAG: DUF2586 family protein [Bacteroidales bacterium]
MLPRVKINFESGALGSVVPSPDGVLALLCTATAVADKFDLLTPYVISSLSELENNLGITSGGDNSRMHNHVADFYKVAPQGTELWLMGFSDTVTMANMLDVTNENHAKKLLLAANGRIRGLIVARHPAAGYVPTIENGLDSDVFAAMLQASILGNWAAQTLFAPIISIIEGRGFTGNVIDLVALNDFEYQGVGVFIGSDRLAPTTERDRYESVGLLGGRIASIPVQRNVGRVKDGPLPMLKAYVKDVAVELANISLLHTKGYITLRTFVGKAGYYFNDDHLAVAATDDYLSLSRRRVIDKAYRICYITLLDELLDEIPVNEDGTMQPAMVKMWQSKVENAIALQMTANGELSADVTDPKDRGVECLIDENQNVVSTSKVVVRVRVRPFGYSRYIDVYLGFKAVTT